MGSLFDTLGATAETHSGGGIANFLPLILLVLMIALLIVMAKGVIKLVKWLLKSIYIFFKRDIRLLFS